MKIKYKERESIRVGQGPKKYPMIQVKGEQLDGKGAGNERTIKFFPSEKDMHAVVKNADPGDVLDVTMTQNGNFWNPTAIRNETKDGSASFETGTKPSLKDFTKSSGTSVVSTEMSEKTIRLEAVKSAVKMGFKDIEPLLLAADQISYFIEKGMEDSDIDMPGIAIDDDDDEKEEEKDTDD